MTPQHPRGLPPGWFELWEERAAIIAEGCRLPADTEGAREANRRAFAEILKLMEAEHGRMGTIHG